MKPVVAIYRKELVDTLRDRKTLVFMLLVPTLMIPLLMFGLARLLTTMTKAEQTRTVVIVADEQTQRAYEEMLHQWFLSTEMGGSMRLFDAPVLGAIVRGRSANVPLSPPPGLSTDPQVFAQWTRDFAEHLRANLDSFDQQATPELAELPVSTREGVGDFYRVAIRGLGLVEFVEPSILDEFPDTFSRDDIPEHLHDVESIGRIARAIQSGRVQGVLSIPEDWRETLVEDHSRRVQWTFHHDSTRESSREARSRMDASATAVRGRVLDRRLSDLGLSRDFLRPIELASGTDLATPTRLSLGFIGAFLPYLVIIFAFLGGFYPAIDLGAGEKERQTLETLLLAPVSRTEIALGKYLVILTTSLVAALLGVVSLAVSFKFLVPASIADMLQIRIDPKMATLVAMTTLPTAAIFAGVLLAISIYARSFKEAQNYLAPLQFLLILPALAPQLPGVEMNAGLAIVPLVNVSLLARDFFRGDISWLYYSITMGSSLLVAAICLLYAAWQFRREGVIFRT